MKQILLFMATLLLCTDAAAGETQTMRCNGAVISMDDTIVEVLGKCGEPAYKGQGVATKVVPASPYNQRVVLSVAAETWIYNFGPNEFQYQLYFDGGRVFRIESLDDYGF